MKIQLKKFSISTCKFHSYEPFNSTMTVKWLQYAHYTRCMCKSIIFTLSWICCQPFIHRKHSQKVLRFFVWFPIYRSSAHEQFTFHLHCMQNCFTNFVVIFYLLDCEKKLKCIRVFLIVRAVKTATISIPETKNIKSIHTDWKSSVIEIQCLGIVFVQMTR